MRQTLFLAILLAICLPGRMASAADPLAEGFASPPRETRPWCYWYWIDSNATRKGIAKDLEAMAKVGIGGAFIGDICLDASRAGDSRVLSEKWWSLVKTAAAEGARNGVQIGMFNCPGWSMSGGPWIKPEESMRYVVSSETRVKGPGRFTGKLPAPAEPFQDIAVLAFPAPAQEGDAVSARSPRVTPNQAATEAALLFDGRFDTVCPLPKHLVELAPLTIEVTLDRPITVRSMTLHPGKRAAKIQVELKASAEDGTFHTVRQCVLDRQNTALNVGPMTLGPLAVAFPEVTAKKFQILVTNLGDESELAEIELSAAPRLESYVEKQLGKVFQSPQPMWDSYLWPPQAEPASAGLAVDPASVRNISGNMSSDGTLTWDAPEGEWIVLRTGMTPTGVTNAPASPEGSGLEVDKMNRAAVARHFDAYVGRALKLLDPKERGAFKFVVADSYEMGPQNWTDGFGGEFARRYGYDPKPWMPALTGRIVGSADRSDRFLWDLRRLVADKVAKDYVGGLRRECRKHGLTEWLENYGHWGFPAEFLQYGGAAESIGGEFWADGGLGDIELRAASSAAHIYGKQSVAAEAFTGGPAFKSDPYALKARGDWAYCQGINRFVLHVYIQQPWSDRLPGANAWFGTEFNRNNTWFTEGKAWIDYLRRCQWMLAQGSNVADVAYFIGEDTPKMTGLASPALPEGYGFDYVNAEVLERHAKGKGGRLVLDGGASYKVLVLPPLETMRPEMLRALERLVREGIAVLGDPPSRSPSLEDYPRCDQAVCALAAKLWGECDGKAVKSVRYGKGEVLRGMDLKQAFDRLKVPADVACGRKEILWTHRTAGEDDIYFLSNQADQAADVTVTFRSGRGRTPELWDAVSGKIELAARHESHGEATAVSLTFAPRGSVFVVFRKAASVAPVQADRVELPAAVALEGPWQLQFPEGWDAPAQIEWPKLQSWTESENLGVRYFSGTATYKKTFEVAPEMLAEGRRLTLDLGEVHSLASVRVNGTPLGTVWTPPFAVDITSAARPGANTLDVAVTNVWRNRLIGDATYPNGFPDAQGNLPPGGKPRTFLTAPQLKASDPLLPAGLLGPVTLRPRATVRNDPY